MEWGRPVNSNDMLEEYIDDAMNSSLRLTSLDDFSIDRLGGNGEEPPGYGIVFNEHLHTDRKQPVSIGDTSLDQTPLKLVDDGFSSDEEDDIYVDRLGEEVPQIEANDNLIEEIRLLQEDQIQLKQMQEKINNRLSDLLSTQPGIKSMMRTIRRNSQRGSNSPQQMSRTNDTTRSGDTDTASASPQGSVPKSALPLVPAAQAAPATPATPLHNLACVAPVKLDYGMRMGEESGPFPPMAAPNLQEFIKKNEAIYIQLEQLYANWQRMHVISSSSKIMGKRPIGANNFDAGTGSSEMTRLREENSNLQKRIKDLEKALKESSNTSDRRKNMYVPAGRQNSPQQLSQPQPHQYGSSTSHLTPGSAEARRNYESSPSPFTRQRPVERVVRGRPTSPMAPRKPLDVTLYEATFHWTISNYSRKFMWEKKHEGSREVSTPFYLSHNGYRGQLEAYLNGNGSGTNKGLSAFLRIVQGEYDHQLKWPVNLYFIIILVNQSSNHSECLKAGGNQFQYQRPRGTEDSDSDCWGLVEFVSHDLIRQKQYIKNDTIELKCRIQLAA